MKRLLSYLALALVCCSCENDLATVAAFDSKKLGVDQAYDVETIMSQSAHVKGVLTSRYMERHNTQPSYTEFPRGLKVVFYDDSLQISSVLTAKYGKYTESDQDVYLRDSVVFTNVKTLQRLDCKDLRWDAKRELFVTDRFCKLSTPNQTLYGQGFEAKQDFSYARFRKTYGSMMPPDSTLDF